jgi:hypothetical protein
LYRSLAEAARGIVRSAIKGASMSATTAANDVNAAEPVERRRRVFGKKRIAAVAGVLLAGTGAYAASNWVVGLNATSSGQAQSGSISNLSITAVAAPAASNLLYPGGSGDVVAIISNPNSFPVTVTGVDLPAMTTYAAGYTTSALTTVQAGCTVGTSFVAWTLSSALVGRLSRSARRSGIPLGP